MKKTMQYLAVLLLFLLVWGVGAVSADGTVTVNTTTDSVNPGEKITIPVSLNATDNISAFSIRVLAYPNEDATVIIVNETYKPLDGNYIFNTDPSKGYTIATWENSISNITGKNEIFAIDVVPSSTAPSTIAVDVVIVDMATYNGDEIQDKYSAVNGTLSIKPVLTTVLITEPENTSVIDMAYITSGEALASVCDQWGGSMPDEPVSWFSDNTDVISFTDGGNYTVKGVGNVILTASAGSITNTTFVTVNKTQIPTTINITEKPEAPLLYNQSGTFKAEVFDQDKVKMDAAAVLWSSDNLAVIQVNKTTGEYTAGLYGISTIKASVWNDTAEVLNRTFNVDVLKTPIDLRLNVTTVMSVGNEETARITVLDQSGSPMENVGVVLESDDPSVVTIDTNTGICTPLASGKANITATITEGVVTPITDFYSVRVIDAKITIIEPAGEEITAYVNESMHFEAEGKDINESTIKWVFASVDHQYGKSLDRIFTSDYGLGYAFVQVHAFADIEGEEIMVSDERLITILYRPSVAQNITITDAPASLEIGGDPLYPSDIMYVNVTDQYNREMTDTITWTSSNPSVISVKNNGYCTAVGEGTAVITASPATNESISARAEIQVTKAEPRVTEIRLIPAEKDLVIGKQLTFKATVLDQYGEVNASSVQWNVDPASAGNIDNGKFIAKSAGTANITASVGDIRKNATVTIKEQTPTHVRIIAPQTLTQGNGGIFGAIVYDEYYKVLSEPVVWTSTDSSVISILNESLGTYYVSGTGNAVITASVRGNEMASVSFTGIQAKATPVVDSITFVPKKEFPLAKDATVKVASVAVNTTKGVVRDAVYAWSSENTDFVTVSPADTMKATLKAEKDIENAINVSVTINGYTDNVRVLSGVI